MRQGFDGGIVGGTIVHMALVFDLVVAVFYFINYPIEDFDKEGEQGLFIVFTDDVVHAQVFDVVEGIGQGKEYATFAGERCYFSFDTDNFVPNAFKEGAILCFVCREQVELELYDAVPYFEDADTGLLLRSNWRIRVAIAVRA